MEGSVQGLLDIRYIIKEQYGIDITSINRMTTGVGGDTFLITSTQGKFVFKIADTNEMNRPECEPAICNYLLQHGIRVSDFYPNMDGKFVFQYENRYYHLQRYNDGTVFNMNTAPEWFMRQSPLLLGKIHKVLYEYEDLPIGIGKEFFYYMTFDRANQQYRQSLKIAIERKEESIMEDLEFRIRLTESLPGMQFDIDKLTYKNTHGDYTVNQMICDESKIKAVIDWTSACRHPVIWELSRSFFYAEPTCMEGKVDDKKFAEYIDAYCSIENLNVYDKENLLKLYFYQLAVCDYYNQYLNSEDTKKGEYLIQAKFATKVLRNGSRRFLC